MNEGKANREAAGIPEDIALGSHTGTRPWRPVSSVNGASWSSDVWKIPDGASRLGILFWKQREVTEKRKGNAMVSETKSFPKSNAVCSQCDLGQVKPLKVFFCKMMLIISHECDMCQVAQGTWLL